MPKTARHKKVIDIIRHCSIVEREGNMKIKELRNLTGLSQSKFATKYSINVRTLQSWEADKRTPPAHTLAMLERIVKEDTEKAKQTQTAQ